MTVAELLISFVLRSFALSCLCAAAAWLLRSHAAPLRFLIWKCMLLALFALPVLTEITPPLAGPARVIQRMEVTVSRAVPVPSATTINRRQRDEPPARPNSFNWRMELPVMYLLVTLVLILRPGYSLITLRTIAARSCAIRDSNFHDISHDIWLKSGAFIKPRLAVSQGISSPVSFNAGDAWILLPTSWQSWDEAKLRAVLTHEMAHVQRNDARTLLLASLATCVFWFHPLSWFLQKQLAALAEEACDEVVISHEATPEQYANFLIDFARDVKLGHGRFAGAIAFTGNSLLKRRIQRLFAAHRNSRGLAALALVLFMPALYLTAASRPNQPQEAPAMIWPQQDPTLFLSAGDIANLESDLRANPEDLNLRMKLLVYYGIQGHDQEFTSHLLWFIQHRPDVHSLSMAQGIFNRKVQLSDQSRAQIQQAWEQALATHSDSPATLFNAADFLPEHVLELLKQAKKVRPENREHLDHSIALIYAAAEIEPIHPDTKLNNIQMSMEAAARLDSALAASRDPALLSETGRLLVSAGAVPNTDPQFKRGLALIQQAINLDPGNTKWTEALESAQFEPARRASQDALMQPQTSQQLR